MQKVVLGGHEVVIYDNIEDLPIRRFQKFNKMMLIDSGIGSDLTDYSRHIQRLMVYNTKGDREKIQIELQNLQQNLQFITSELSPRFMAFACLVQSIDGKPQTIDDDNLKTIIETLNIESVGKFTDVFVNAKKKIDSELTLYFPNMGETSEQKEFFDLIRKRTLAILNGIINDVENSQSVKDITDSLLIFTNPKQFDGSKNVEVEYDKEFEKICHFINSELNINAKLCTVVEFYTTIECIKDKQRQLTRKI